MKWWVLSTQDFYTKVAEYTRRVDPSWDEEWLWCQDGEYETLKRILGEGSGRSVLDCSCGEGRQAIPLAKLGWQVAASDLTEACLVTARQHAQQEGLQIDFRRCDMRDLGQRFGPSFDWVVSCMALDNIVEDQGIRRAVQGMYDVLKPSGRCYIRLRNFDSIMSDRPRYEFKEERRLPHGRVIRMEDWDYESETHVVHIYVFMLEDERKKETTWSHGWDYTVFAHRRRALRQAELKQFLSEAGFQEIEFLPRPDTYDPPHEVVASKGS